MIWAILFAVSIAQGLFLISLVASRSSKNRVASNLIISIVLVMIFTNLGYLVIRTDLVYYVPQVWGIQFGMTFLLGPLFYFYSQSVIDQHFQWRKKYWLHFIPYGIQLFINLPFLLRDRSLWVAFIHTFLAGDSSMRGVEKITFGAQDLQLFFYLALTVRWIRSAKHNYGDFPYIISIPSRIKWITTLAHCLFLFSTMLFSLYIFVLVRGRYNPITNYIYTLVSSGIIYFIAYKLVLNPDLINPDFRKKYRAYMPFTGEDGEKYLQKLKSLMDETRIFTDPGLKLSSLAKKIGLPSHQVSKLINEKFGKSFNEYINEYRVKEFISRVSQVQNQSYTLYGIALDVGFNSKSSFHSAFKKYTGKVPSDYKISS